MPFEAIFLPADPGQRFCLFHPARGGERGAVLYVHPFAEEMNKSRRMAALQSRALADAGFSVLQLDLLGCGDSSGDFGDATWTAWIEDVLLGCAWLQARSPAPLWLWGLRGGCLVAADAAARLATRCSLLFWQPSLSGKLVLQQFLRLKVAGDMLNGRAKGVMEAMRGELAAQRPVEVAGYRLSAQLAHGLEHASLGPTSQVQRLEWIELSSRSDAVLSSASADASQAWRRHGCTVGSRVVTGPAFWQTSEIEEAPMLIDATLAAVREVVCA